MSLYSASLHCYLAGGISRSLPHTSAATHQNSSGSSPHCPGWGDATFQGLRLSDAKSALRANWNSFVVRGFFLRRVADESRLKKFTCGSAVSALIPFGAGTSLSKGGRLVQNLDHQMFLSSPCSSDYVRTVTKSRLAYGYYLGPAYGYGGGFGFGGGGSIFLLIILGFLAVQAFTNSQAEGLTRTREKVSVMKLQVGLLGIARNLQSDLERIADRADTSTTRGLHYVLTETVLALLRQPDMCILGTSSADVKKSVEAGERRFNQLSLEERGKFDEETLVNVDGNRKRDSERSRSDGFGNEYIVVTVLVAAEGEYKLPTIYSNSDMRDALQTLGSIPADRLQGVEILWTPQDKNETLTERDLLRNYPLLKSL